jgi:hypothetical protein
MLLTRIRKSHAWSLRLGNGYPDWDYLWFSPVAPNKSRNNTPMRLRLLPSKSFPIHDSAISLPSEAIWHIHSFIHSSMALQPFCWALDSSSVSWSFYTVGRTPWTSDQPVARPLLTHRATQTQNKRTHTQTSMPRVGFEREKTVHALDRSATVIGIQSMSKYSSRRAELQVENILPGRKEINVIFLKHF